VRCPVWHLQHLAAHKRAQHTRAPHTHIHLFILSFIIPLYPSTPIPFCHTNEQHKIPLYPYTPIPLTRLQILQIYTRVCIFATPRSYTRLIYPILFYDSNTSNTSNSAIGELEVLEVFKHLILLILLILLIPQWRN